MSRIVQFSDIAPGLQPPIEGAASDESRSVTVSFEPSKWQLVHRALEDQSWDLRTVEGISKDTGLGESSVEEVLQKHHGEIRRRPSRKGHGFVYTLKSKKPSYREWLSDMRFWIAKGR